MNQPLSNLTAPNSIEDQLIQLISPWVVPLGYQIIHLEVQSHRQKVLRIYIDYLEPSAGRPIGIEDCVRVSRALDEPLDQLLEIEAILRGSYELEVSSPGVNRPLRTSDDFRRFADQRVRVHTYRPLTADELGHPVYQQKNPKQKNFLGILKGLQLEKIVLSLPTKNLNEEIVTIPLSLISKANLEPDFDFEGSDEREIEL